MEGISYFKINKLAIHNIHKANKVFIAEKAKQVSLVIKASKID